MPNIASAMTPKHLRWRGAAISLDFVASAWVAAGRALKPDEVSPCEAAAVGVDEAAWRDLSYAGKKELAHKVLRQWLEGNQ